MPVFLRREEVAIHIGLSQRLALDLLVSIMQLRHLTTDHAKTKWSKIVICHAVIGDFTVSLVKLSVQNRRSLLEEFLRET